MTNRVIRNNLSLESKSSGRRGWFIGHFRDVTSPFYSDKFEVKYAVHPKGDRHSIPKKNKIAKSVSILVSGKGIWKFPDLDEEYILDTPGDYCYWDNEVYHFTEFLEDSVVLTLRWPSLEKDQVEKGS